MIKIISVLKLIVISISVRSIKSRSLNQSILFNEFGYSFNSIEIDLSRKSINSIDSKTFQGLHNLEVLYLEDNKLTKLENDLFKNLINLKEIWLEHNGLVSIDKNIFVGLNNLERVCLYDNPISTIFPTEVQLLCETNPKCLLSISEKCIKIGLTTLSNEIL